MKLKSVGIAVLVLALITLLINVWATYDSFGYYEDRYNRLQDRYERETGKKLSGFSVWTPRQFWMGSLITIVLIVIGITLTSRS